MAFLTTFACQYAPRRWTSLSRVWFAVFALMLTGRSDLPAQTTTSPEYQIKAVFLFNFAQFVEWPTNAFAGAESPLIIGVLGDDPFGAYLDEIVRGQKVNHRPLAIQRYRGLEEIKTCHLLFVSQSEKYRLDQILASLKDRNILTVGDAESFAQRGGMVRFVTEKNKIRLRINLEAATEAKLTISSKLLRPAEIVAPGKD